MATNPEVARLRAEVKRQRANATAKARRLRSQGIVVQGTEHDPRRVAGIENTYNARQLRAYVAGLRAFNSRSTQFVAGADGRAISKLTYSLLRSTVNVAQESARRRRERVANEIVPGTDSTFDEMQRMTKRTRRPVQAYTYDTVDIRPDELVSDAKARELMRTVASRSTGAGRRRMNAIGSRNVNKMLRQSSSPFLAARWDELTGEQQEVLMNTPGFWDAAAFTAYDDTRTGEEEEQASQLADFFAFARRVAPER